MKFLLLFLTVLTASGANRYVRSGATGAGSAPTGLVLVTTNLTIYGNLTQ